MNVKSLKEVYGFTKKVKKLTPKMLQKIIREQEEKKETPDESSSADSGKFSNPKMSEMSADGNIADYDAVEIVAQMMSGDPKAPIYKAIAKFHNPQFTPGISKADTPEGAKEISAWVKSKKPDFLLQNIQAVQTKLPKSGTPKDSMPALEPMDVAHVEDALSPGGNLSIDMTAPYAGEEEGVEAWHQSQESSKKEKKEESIRKMLDILLEDKYPQGHKSGMPGAPAKGEKSAVSIGDIKGLALSFLTKGLEKNDKSGNDDTIEVKQDEPIDVASMEPTQKNVLLGKALAFALGGGFGGQSLGAYVTGGNEILDGHHRWAGTMIVDPGAGIKGHKVMAPASDILPILTALGNALGRQQKGMDHGDAAAESMKESIRSSKTNEDLLMERWKKLAGLLNG